MKKNFVSLFFGKFEAFTNNYESKKLMNNLRLTAVATRKSWSETTASLGGTSISSRRKPNRIIEFYMDDHLTFVAILWLVGQFPYAIQENIFFCRT